MKYIYTLLACVTIFVSCQTLAPLVIVQDPLALQEIAPLPRALVRAEKEEEFEPIYAVFRIVEVSEVNGVQRYFLARIGNNRTGIRVGVSDSIAEDPEFKKIIGKYKIIEIFGDFFRCEIEELDYKIGDTAYLRVKTGQQVKVSDTEVL